jgi:hypothetical protein
MKIRACSNRGRQQLGCLFHFQIPKENTVKSMSPGCKGSLAELRVACHLIGLGFHVYKNLSVNGPVDLLALRGRRAIRVQVKSTLSMNQFKNLRQGGCELLAVLIDGEIRYRALDRKVQALVPGSILARRPRKERPRATATATKVATKKATKYADL